MKIREFDLLVRVDAIKFKKPEEESKVAAGSPLKN
jgi:hypothetical protein